MDKIPVGVSACLLGHQVRYNGGHSQSRLCIKHLSEYFDFRAFCPEISAGFGTPRPTMRLVGNPDYPDLVATDAHKTDPGTTVSFRKQLEAGFRDTLNYLNTLDGYVLMKNSPSCGMERVKVYQDNGYPHQQSSRGIFAQALIDAFPLLPVEEEGRLNDPQLRENFILRVYTHQAFRHGVEHQPSFHKLLQFHSRNKYLLLAHSQSTYRKLGKRLANAFDEEIKGLTAEYKQTFMQALAKPANRKNHTNVLLHILGYVKDSLSSQARQHIATTIHKYRLAEIPLITPLTLLKHYVDQFGNDYIRQQRYLQPYPEALGLVNRI